MNKKILSPAAAVTLLIFLWLGYFLKTGTGINSSANNSVSSKNISGNKAFLQKTNKSPGAQSLIKSKSARKKTGKVVSSKRDEASEEHKSDSPDKFALFESRIRTHKGASAPDYPLNYKMIELNKAYMKRFGVSLNAFNSMNGKIQATKLNWIERGPGNVSGRTRGFIVDPDDITGNTWFAASVGGGVWKTTNGGVSWTDLTPNLPDLATTVLAMAPSDHNIIYLGTGEGFYNVDAISGNGIFKSTDRGATWNQLTSTANSLEFQNIDRIIVSPSDPNILLTCTNVGFNSKNIGFNSGIFKSTDGGNSWKQVYNSNLHSVQQLYANPKDFNTIFASVNTLGIIKSTDEGETWDTTSGIITTGRVELAMAPEDTSRLYASAESLSSSGLFISKDAGNNWSSVKDAAATTTNWLGGQGWYGNVLAVNPFYEDSVIVGGIDLYKLAILPGTDTVHYINASLDKTDSFMSFIDWGGTLLNGGAGEGTYFLGAVDLADTDYVSVEVRFGPGISQKAHRFTSGLLSETLNYQDYVNVPFQVWDVTHNRQLMVSFLDADSSGVFKLVKMSYASDFFFINSVKYDPNNPSPAIAKTDGEKYKNIYAVWPVLRDGAVWDPNNLPASKIIINYDTAFEHKMAMRKISDWSGTGKPYVHADHHNIIIMPVDKASDSYKIFDANDGGCAVSLDDGNSWRQISTYQTTQFYGADKNPNSDQYIGGMQDNGTWYSQVNPSAGSSYTEALGGDGFDVDWKYDDERSMMASIYNDEIYRSTDGGVTWNSAHDGIADAIFNSPFITSIAKTNQDPDLIFTTGNSGVWRSDNFGETWTLSPLSGAQYNALYTPVSISLANPQVVWMGSYLDSTDRLEVSTDGGLTFSTTSFNDIGNTYEVSGIATDPNKDSTAYILFAASRSPKILKTTDLGKTWSDISGFNSGAVSTNGFPDVAVFSLLVMPNHPDTIWAGTEIGLFQSTDGGGSWEIADNGLPPVSIWSMRIVGDQVVAATHGRGIWTVNPPWLSGYTLPYAVKSPRLNNITQGSDGLLMISTSLRSSYDSTEIVINGVSRDSFKMNKAAVDTNVKLPAAAGTYAVQLIAFKSGIIYKSAKEVYQMMSMQLARTTYTNTFDTASNDFYGSGFSIGTQPGFANGAIQSSHPYNNRTNSTCELTIPIIVASSNAELSYDDIALVEPGAAGSTFGSPDFYDYVVVEGSVDGNSWKPLAPGYDCRFNSRWLSAWNNNAKPDSTMYVHHTLNLLNSFPGGTKILIRFRLFADEYTSGWGWIIDNLSIQPETTGITDDKSSLPAGFSLSQNFPNPFNPSTTINYSVPKTSYVTLKVYDILGREISILVNEEEKPGNYSVRLSSDRLHLSSGVYFYRIKAGSFSETKKLMLLK